jgi:hypothetical protein
MTLIFYILVLFCITIEVSGLTQTERVIRASKNVRDKMAEDGDAKSIMGFDRQYMQTQALYTILVLIGLFSTQWILFLLLIVIGVASTPLKHNPTFRRVDAFISILILLFIVVNKYHLHLDLVETLKGIV